MTQLRLMALGGVVLLYGLAFGIALGITALYKRRERQQSTLPAAVDAVPVGLRSGDAQACTLAVRMAVQGDPLQ
jgi:Flp pilus assembly protein TadB